jgi:general secretion pathway protein G
MPTSRPERRAPARGFTLIELLVVMVLLGLMAGLALPAMQRWFDAVQAKAHGAAMVDALRAAAFAAGANRREQVLDERSFAADAAASVAAPGGDGAAGAPAAPAVPIALPPGWALARVEPATFLASGLCKPGRARVQAEAGRAFDLVVHGPVCRVELSEPQR